MSKKVMLSKVGSYIEVYNPVITTLHFLHIFKGILDNSIRYSIKNYTLYYILLKINLFAIKNCYIYRI